MSQAYQYGGVVELIDPQRNQITDRERYCAACLPGNIPDVSELITEGMRAIIRVSDTPRPRRYCAACGEACTTPRPDTLAIPMATI